MDSYTEKLVPRAQRKLLALDGGGIRGLITIEVLAKIEQLLQKELGRDDSFVLADYFDYPLPGRTVFVTLACRPCQP